MDRTSLGGDLTRDALAESDANLGPQFGLDALRNSNSKYAGIAVQEHQAAAFGTRNPDRDLEHSFEEFIAFDCQVDGFDDFV